LTEENRTELFSGVRVVELASWVFVPVAGALLADWGAEVTKVEHPVTGDGYRGLVTQGMGGPGINPSMELANRGKRSIGLDLKSPAGREVMLRLVSQADVFLTNHLPSVLDRLGLGVEALRAVNPGLIYARGHGFGVRGPEADRPAYDSTAFWARGGLGETLTPSDLEQPIPQRGAVGDRNGAVHLAFGIAGALFRRERTGEGSTVDVSLLATAMWMLGSDVLAALAGTFVPTGPANQGERRAISRLVCLTARSPLAGHMPGRRAPRTRVGRALQLNEGEDGEPEGLRRGPRGRVRHPHLGRMERGIPGGEVPLGTVPTGYRAHTRSPGGRQRVYRRDVGGRHARLHADRRAPN
jgi:crotonobetainyl-CoA:carnitine CoA-transferase CaiB-like acyl-CoA transferase